MLPAHEEILSIQLVTNNKNARQMRSCAAGLSAEKFWKTYQMIRMYFWDIIFQMQSANIQAISGGRVIRAKCLHGKIFISPRRYPTFLCRELAKASYSAASCKQSPRITVSFYNSWDLAVAE